MTWRLLRALAASRLEDITSEDSGLWDALNRVLDDAVDLGEVRPLTASLAVDLRSLTDRASRHVETGLTEETRARACGLLREVRDRLGRDTLDIGLLRRLAWMTEEVAGEVLAPAPSAATSEPAAGWASACSPVASGWAGQWSRGPAPAAYSAASA
ncbi:hypothetical protein Slala04_01200 [Streptomyces lavendulae subsp. lavendulae]|nr:hypothetical protein Slala04_01200 [Streptomyces lavendulae subsp. lavendulae]